MRRNILRGPIGFRNSLAKYTRRGSDLDTYWFIQSGLDDHQFETGSVCHVINPDIHQEIYGMPEYFAGLLSANLAHSADKFRKLYYDNGSHAGCIVYVSSAVADGESLENLKKTLTDTRRGGAFKNILLSAPGDVEKAARVFAVNELTPVMEAMKHVNDWLGEEVIRFNPYALLETPK